MIELYKILLRMFNDKSLLRNITYRCCRDTCRCISETKFLTEQFLTTHDIAKILVHDDQSQSYDYIVVLDDRMYLILDDSLDRQIIKNYYWLRNNERLLATLVTVCSDGHVEACDYIYDMKTQTVKLGYVARGDISDELFEYIGGKGGFYWLRDEGILSLRIFDSRVYEKLPDSQKHELVLNSVSTLRIKVNVVTTKYYIDWLDELENVLDDYYRPIVMNILLRTAKIRKYMERTGKI